MAKVGRDRMRAPEGGHIKVWPSSMHVALLAGNDPSGEQCS
jgi:hypothetical protein